MRTFLSGARARAGAAAWPALQAALAATLAWLIAHNLLGHPQPFFAPISGATALSTSQLQRARRTVQMALGVLLGIAIGEALSALIGQDSAALGLVVLTTMLVARALAAGFVGAGMVFANQATASAVLVVVLHHSGTGGERALDALVGGAVALIVGVGVFPAQPLRGLREAERTVFAAQAAALERIVALLRAGTPGEPGWTLDAAFDIHQALAQLADARSTARANVLVAPRRWHLRRFVRAEDRRLARLHLLADATLGLVRAATAALESRQPLPASVADDLAELATAMGRLARAPAPWSPRLLDAVDDVAERAIARQAGERADWTPVVASTLGTAARDLQAAIRLDPTVQAKPVRGAGGARVPRRKYLTAGQYRTARPVRNNQRN